MTKKMAQSFAWIGSGLLIGFLLWFFTMSYRTRLLTEIVNKALTLSGGGRIESASGFFGNPSSVMGGTWFTMANSSDRAFVFTMIRHGMTAACVALVDNTGKVRAIIPLSDNARQITEELPLPLYNFYVDRIERDIRNRDIKRRALR